MKTIFIHIFVFAAVVHTATAQTSLEGLEPSEYFDFWIGDWELTWQAPDGTIEKGTNSIERILNEKVIKENFEATSGRMEGYVGKSYSVYNSQTSEWKQTWVDNNGSYLDFTGKFEGDKRIFFRKTKDAGGITIVQRMIFYDIKENSFQWNWEKSTDNGESWELQWKIAYRRVEE